MTNYIETSIEVITISKKQTQRMINKIIEEQQGDKSFFICTNNDDVRNNGYSKYCKGVDFEENNVIICHFLEEA